MDKEIAVVNEETEGFAVLYRGK